MKVICRDRQQKSRKAAPEGRVVSSVASDIDRLLATKSYDDLVALEVQILNKLKSNEPIDVDYWEQLLQNLTVWKARATLTKVYQSVIASRLEDMRRQQLNDAENVREKLQVVLDGVVQKSVGVFSQAGNGVLGDDGLQVNTQNFNEIDPEPLLKIRAEDKSFEVADEMTFLQRVVCSLNTVHGRNTCYLRFDVGCLDKY